jgi:hypothetical protein
VTTKQRLHSLIDALPDGDDRLEAVERMLDNSSSRNDASSKGFTRFGFIDEADRLEVEAQRVAFRELREELAAQGVDSSAEYAIVLAKAANWSSA